MRSVFITGGTTGIGWALALDYLEKGYKVGVCGRDLKKIISTKNEENLFLYECSVTEKESLKNAILDFHKVASHIDIIIANAGIAISDKKSWPDFERAISIVETNIKGVIYTFEIGAQLMRQRGQGHLVAVASVAGFRGLPGAGAYCGSKAFVIKFCETMGIDLNQYGINVSCICPGFIDTPLTKKNNHYMPFIMSANEASSRIIKAIENKKSIFIFPKRMCLLIGLLRIFPYFLYRKIILKLGLAKMKQSS